MVIFVLNWHLLRAEDIVSRFAYGAQSLSVPRPPGPGENLGNDEELDEDEVPEQLVVDDDGENKVESKEPEKNRDPAGQLRMILTFGKNIYLMI